MLKDSPFWRRNKRDETLSIDTVECGIRNGIGRAEVN